MSKIIAWLILIFVVLLALRMISMRNNRVRRHAAEASKSVKTGDPMVRWDPSTISGEDISTVVPVVAMDRPKGSVPAPTEGLRAVTGELLFTVDT